uniref:Uncharacterized protein n=1 Tax=Octopus bimaculoides TaxID=37653 RepID=A0A0L8GI82_OCTBM
MFHCYHHLKTMVLILRQDGYLNLSSCSTEYLQMNLNNFTYPSPVEIPILRLP